MSPPCIPDTTRSNTDRWTMKHERQSIAEHLPYPRPSTRSEASSITEPSAKQLLPRMCLRKAKQKDDREMESERRIQHAQEVCRGERYSADKDIRQPILPFVRFSLFISYSSHLSLTVLRSSLVLSKSFVLAYDLFTLYCSLISFVYYRCSYQYKFCAVR